MTMLAARAVSLEKLRGAPPQAPEMPDLEPNSVAALEYLESLKEDHYVAVALTIDALMAEMQQRRGERPQEGLAIYESRVETLKPWQQLRGDFIETFIVARKAIESSVTYQNNQHYNDIIGTLNRNRFLHLDIQLLAGSDTASTSMLTLLRNMPRILEHQGLHDQSYGDIARRSSGLPWRLAVTCVNRMMGIQQALLENDYPNSWSFSDSRLDPTNFKLVFDNHSVPALHFQNLNNMTTTSDYQPLSDIPPVWEKGTRIGNIACSESKIVGCPITLVKERFHELWKWHIDAVEARGLWTDESWLED